MTPTQMELDALRHQVSKLESDVKTLTDEVGKVRRLLVNMTSNGELDGRAVVRALDVYGRRNGRRFLHT